MDNRYRQTKNIIAFLVLVMIVLGIHAATSFMTPSKTYNYSEIVNSFKNHQVTKYEMKFR